VNPTRRSRHVCCVQNEHKFSTFKEFKDAVFMPLMLAFKKHAISKGVAKDKDDIKEKGQRMATLGLKWIQENFKDIEFYSLESTVVDGSDFGEEFKDDSYSANFVSAGPATVMQHLPSSCHCASPSIRHVAASSTFIPLSSCSAASRLRLPAGVPVLRGRRQALLLLLPRPLQRGQVLSARPAPPLVLRPLRSTRC